MSLNDEVIKVLPLLENEAVTASDIFKSCTWAEDLKSISTSLSNLYAAKLISRKETINGRAKYAYWNAVPFPADISLSVNAPKTLIEEVNRFSAAIEANKSEKTTEPTPKSDEVIKKYNEPLSLQIIDKKVFEIVGHEKSLGEFYQVGDEWNGMVEFKTREGLKLIVNKSGSKLSEVFGGVFGIEPITYQVVKGSPEIIEKLLIVN